MIKKYIVIFKNYYELIKDDKRKLIPYYIGYFINCIVELLIPIYVSKITENLTNSLLTATIISIIMYFFLKTMNSLISCFNMYNYSNFFKNNYITLYRKIVKEIYNFDSEYKKKFSTGRMINSLTEDVINVGEMADNILTIILSSIKCIVISFYFIKVNIFFSLFIIFVDIVYINRSNYLNNMSLKYLSNQREVNDKLIGLINQTMLGLKDIQTLDFSNSLNEKYNSIYKSWKDKYSKKRKYQILRKTILKCFLTLTKVIVYFICAYLIIKKEMTIGVMLIIISYFDSLFSSSMSIMDSSISIRNENMSVNRIKEILEYNKNTEYTIKKLKNVKGLIQFKKVYFSYSNNSFLSNLNIDFEPNKITALVGSNGTGKTTIINLILLAYSPNKGEILLDGNNINSIEKKEYLNQITVLNQDTFLFNLSIRQNLNLINKDRLLQQKVCKFVGIDKFIKKLPKGYDTIIGENSSNLSGGQKRLLSLARSLLKPSKVIILDEATSSIDTDITKNIINILKKLKKNHTVILITHKKEIIKIADKVITIDKGKAKTS